MAISPVKPSLDLRHRLIGVRRVRNYPLIDTIYKEIQLLQHCLTDDHLVAQDECLFQGIPPCELNDQGLRHWNGFLPPISIFGDALTTSPQAETLRHVNRNDRPHRARVYQRIRFVDPQLMGDVVSHVDLRFHPEVRASEVSQEPVGSRQ